MSGISHAASSHDSPSFVNAELSMSLSAFCPVHHARSAAASASVKQVKLSGMIYSESKKSGASGPSSPAKVIIAGLKSQVKGLVVTNLV